MAHARVAIRISSADPGPIYQRPVASLVRPIAGARQSASGERQGTRTERLHRSNPRISYMALSSLAVGQFARFDATPLAPRQFGLHCARDGEPQDSSYSFMVEPVRFAAIIS